LKSYNEQFDALDILNIASFLLGYENLLENRSQSAQNDVNAANDKQAKLLLDEIGKRLDNQDSALERIERLLHDKLQE
jgi:hypothetical protein